MFMAFEAQTVTVNGAQVALQRGGKGEPLLFLHGADGLTEWPAILDALSADYDVIAPDLPGFGQTPIPDFVDDISDVAYFGLDLLETLCTGRKVRILGHSLGGWAALEMAVRSQEQIHALALIAPAGIQVKGAHKADIYMIDPDEQARLAYADAALGEAAAQRALAGKYQQQAILNRIASARLGWSPRLANPRLERWLHRVHVPTLVLWGDADRIIPPVYADAFAAAMPGSAKKIISKAGHLPHVEQQNIVLATLREFLAR
jgi:pimeloyl-ACP methyl ester carboxylesterase